MAFIAFNVIPPSSKIVAIAKRAREQVVSDVHFASTQRSRKTASKIETFGPVVS